MQNASPPRRGRPKLSATQAPPSASALNALSSVVAANSIANSNVTTSHFLGAGTLKRPWMQPNAASARPAAAVSTSNTFTAAVVNQASEGRLPARHISTVQASATDSACALPSAREDVRPPSYQFVPSSAAEPVSHSVSIHDEDSNKENDISTNNTATSDYTTSLQETAPANKTPILDLIATKDQSHPVQSPVVPQPTVSISSSILDMSDNPHFVARNTSTPVPGLDVHHSPAGCGQDDRSPNAAPPHTNNPMDCTSTNAAAHIFNGLDGIETVRSSSFTRSQPVRTSSHANPARSSSNMPPAVLTHDLNNTNPPPHDSSMSNRPLPQAIQIGINPYASPAQLLTPEPSPLNRAAPLAHDRGPAQKPPQPSGLLSQVAFNNLQPRGQLVPQPVSLSRSTSVSSFQSSFPADTDARLRGMAHDQANNSSDNRGLSYLATLESNTQDMSRRVDLNNYQWNLRLPWLRDACHRGDLCFLHLHQLFCMRDMNVTSVRHLGVGPDCDLGFKVMELLFGRNKHLPGELLPFMAGWPNSTYSLEVNEQTKQWTSEIVQFLPILGSRWIPFRDGCLARRVAPMASEIIHCLACPLTVMLPRAMFCSIQKSLCPNASQDLQSATFSLFNKNATTTYRGQREGSDFQSFRAAYHTIYAQHLTNPRLTENELAEIKFVLHHDSPGINTCPPASTQPAHLSTRTLSMQSFHDNGIPNTARSIVASPHYHAPNVVPSRNNRRSSNPQYTSTMRAPYLPTHVQYNGQSGLIRQLQNGSDPVQNNHVHMHVLPPRPGPIQEGYMRMHNSHRVSGRSTNIPSSSNPRTRPSLSSPTLPLQYFAMANDALLPAPGGRLPDRHVNPDPTQESLHQVLLRQPVTKLKQPLADDCQRLFQFIKTFVLKPHQWVPALGFINLDFEVSEELLNERSEVVEASKGPFNIPERVISVDSVLFNLRCAKLTSNLDKTEMDSSWPALPTYWPQHIFISVNAQHLDLKRKRHNVRDLPVDVTSFLRAGKNEVTISAHPEENESNIDHGIAVEVIGFCDYKGALTLPTKISAEGSLKAITDSMQPQHNSDNDDLILVDNKMTISVTDPFSSRMFTTPVRGRLCKHRECFDLETFLNSRQSDHKDELTSVYRWQCPICKSDARPHQLIIDEFFQGVCNKIVEQGSADEARAIVVNIDGSWTLKSNASEGQSAARKSSRQRSQSSRPSPLPSSLKRTRHEDETIDENDLPRNETHTSVEGTPNGMPTQNSRIAEIIELD